MTLRNHKKHGNLKKSGTGKYARNEISLLGAPCDRIEKIYKNLSDLLKQHKVSYMDAKHGTDGAKFESESIYRLEHDHHTLNFKSENTDYDLKSFFNSTDLLITNGNHFLTDHQIIIINQKKKDSLFRKLDKIKGVKAILLDEGETELYSFLKDHLKSNDKISVFRIDQLKELSDLISELIQKNSPKVKGLVLAGGKSLRMGEDKNLITYHNKPQLDYAYELLSEYCDDVFISVSSKSTFDTNYPVIEDTFYDLGPYGGILSAFQNDPDSAWLSIASDIPLLKAGSIKKLLKLRDLSKYATCFHNQETNFPEPLITIWEPRAYQRMLYFLSMGYSCPRKVLINSDICEIKDIDQQEIINANTPEEAKFVKQIIEES